MAVSLSVKPMRTRVKICGITSVAAMQEAVYAGADAIGLVFYEKSSRHLELAQARAILQAMPAFVTSVALFVDASAARVQQVIAATGVDLLQFHGQESPEFCQGFDRPYIKAVPMQAKTDLNELAQTYSSAQGLLLDTYKKGVPGGTGEVFNWQWVSPEKTATLKLPIILAGGLHADNVAQAIETVRPWAVDVSGGVEEAPGQKSAEKMQQFVQAVNRHLSTVTVNSEL